MTRPRDSLDHVAHTTPVAAHRAPSHDLNLVSVVSA
jgi:hypothetical protein